MNRTTRIFILFLTLYLVGQFKMWDLKGTLSWVYYIGSLVCLFVAGYFAGKADDKDKDINIYLGDDWKVKPKKNETD